MVQSKLELKRVVLRQMGNGFDGSDLGTQAFCLLTCVFVLEK